MAHYIVSTSFGSLLASSAISSCFVKTISRLNVLIVFPSRSSVDQPPPSLHGVPWGEFPRFIGTIQRLRLLASPPRFVAFTQQFHPAPPCSFPTSMDATLAGPGLLLSRGARTAALQCRMESTRPPRFLGNPCVHAPLFDPGGPLTPGQIGESDAAFRNHNDVGSAIIFFSWLYHAAYTLPVYASHTESLPQYATLSSGWWLTFAGTGLSPAGFQ